MCFSMNRAFEDPAGLEAYKLAIGKGEIQLGLLLSNRFSWKLLLNSKRPVALFLMKLLTCGKDDVIKQGFAKLVWFFWFLIAFPSALMFLIKDMIRHGSAWASNFQMLGDTFAFYPEISGRTRPLFAALKDWNTSTAIQIIILGRPRMRLSEAKVFFRSHLHSQSLEVCYPFDWSAFLQSIPHLPHKLFELIKRSVESGYFPAYIEVVGAIYRLWAGLMAQNWVLRVNPKFDARLWMCHTGLFDTSSLELAFQKKGIKTVHWVHGVSEGINFSGMSDYAVFRCAHDARWHEKIGGYRYCLSWSNDYIKLDGLKPNENSFLLMTNYAHFMNFGYQLNGLHDEIRALEEFAHAVQMYVGANEIRKMWKPHPIFYQLPESQQAYLLEIAGNLGYAIAGFDISLEELLRQFKYIACTQSTIALDILAKGHVPVLLCIQQTDPDYSLARMSLKASDSESLRDAWNFLKTDDNLIELLKEDVSRIGPSDFPKLQQVIELIGSK